MNITVDHAQLLQDLRTHLIAEIVTKAPKHFSVRRFPARAPGEKDDLVNRNGVVFYSEYDAADKGGIAIEILSADKLSDILARIETADSNWFDTSGEGKKVKP